VARATRSRSCRRRHARRHRRRALAIFHRYAPRRRGAHCPNVCASRGREGEAAAGMSEPCRRRRRRPLPCFAVELLHVMWREEDGHDAPTNPTTPQIRGHLCCQPATARMLVRCRRQSSLPFSLSSIFSSSGRDKENRTCHLPQGSPATGGTRSRAGRGVARDGESWTKRKKGRHNHTPVVRCGLHDMPTAPATTTSSWRQ
jgi:hypothetical protein